MMSSVVADIATTPKRADALGRENALERSACGRSEAAEEGEFSDEKRDDDDLAAGERETRRAREPARSGARVGGAEPAGRGAARPLFPSLPY